MEKCRTIAMMEGLLTTTMAPAVCRPTLLSVLIERCAVLARCRSRPHDYGIVDHHPIATLPSRIARPSGHHVHAGRCDIRSSW